MTTPEISKIAGLSAGALALVREDLSPSQYLDLLEEKEMFQDAVNFHAHSLPPEGAIQWAHKCVEELDNPETRERREESMAAIAKWLQLRDDASRRAARDVADQGGIDGAADLVGMAVFYSGGSIGPPDAPEMQPPPYMGQKLGSAGVLVAVASCAPEKAAERYHRALAIAREG